jgi:hypothetical protein
MSATSRAASAVVSAYSTVAAPRRLALERLEPHVEILERPVAARLQRGARRREVDRGHRVGACRHEFRRQLLQVLLQTLVGEFLAGARLEMHRLDLHRGIGKK